MINEETYPVPENVQSYFRIRRTKYRSNFDIPSPISPFELHFLR